MNEYDFTAPTNSEMRSVLWVIDFSKSRVVRFAASHWIAFPRFCAGTVRLTLSRSP